MDSDTFPTELGRVSLLHDASEVDTVRPGAPPGAESARSLEDDPRFDEFERPTRLLRDAGGIPQLERQVVVRKAWIVDLELGVDVEFFAGLTRDISEGGLFVTTYQAIPIGTRLLVCFHLPGGEQVEARGEVRWVRRATEGGRPGLGIAFTDLPHETQNGISTLVESLPPLYYER